MVVSIEDNVLSLTDISELQITGDWDSVFTKGRLLLNTNAMSANTVVNDYIRIGSNVTIVLSQHVVYFKILSFNFIQELEGSSKTAGDLLELILISPWFLNSTIKTTAHYGNCSGIIENILEKESNVDSLEIEHTSDPQRRRYQLGIDDFEFIGTLRPYLSSKKSPAFLFNSLYEKTFKVTTFDSLKNGESIFTLNASGSNIKIESLAPAIINSKFYYDENKRIEGRYKAIEIIKDLQIESLDDIPDSLFLPVKTELLSNLGENYVHSIKYQRWDLSPAEQQITSIRECLLEEVEFNESVFIIEGTNDIFDIGNKITVNVGKEDKGRNSILSNNYIIKSLTLSYDENEPYTKIVAVPLISLD